MYVTLKKNLRIWINELDSNDRSFFFEKELGLKILSCLFCIDVRKVALYDD